jgi:hypothetical protein
VTGAGTSNGTSSGNDSGVTPYAGLYITMSF